jgi:hypothetical protein
MASALRNNEQNGNINRHEGKGKLVTKSPPRHSPPPPRRRPPKVDTERALAIRSCARHLKDLRRAHKQPAADVQVNERGVRKFVPPIIEQSYCTSPAALCVELAELGAELAQPTALRTELAELAELGAELAELEELRAELAEPAI